MQPMEPEENNNNMSLIYLLEENWFGHVLLPNLSFQDLRNLWGSNKQAHAVVASLIVSWPEEIRELNRAWCREPNSAALIVGIHSTCNRDVRYKCRHPAPIIRFQINSLAYNLENKRLQGQPWSEVLVNNKQPSALGRIGLNSCFANDEKTQIFCCGGRLFVPEHIGEHDWLEVQDMKQIGAVAAGLFDIETGMWTEVPPMPESRDGAGIFRIGSKIYLLGGQGIYNFQTMLCFDMEENRWDDLRDRTSQFPGDAFEKYTAVV